MERPRWGHRRHDARRGLQNGDSKIDADDLEDALVKAYSAQLRGDVKVWIQQHKRDKGDNAAFITEDDWLEFNRPFVLGDNGRKRGGATLLSTSLLNVKEDALPDARNNAEDGQGQPVSPQ